jgi:hypothetical protein
MSASYSKIIIMLQHGSPPPVRALTANDFGLIATEITTFDAPMDLNRIQLLRQYFRLDVPIISEIQ